MEYNKASIRLDDKGIGTEWQMDAKILASKNNLEAVSFHDAEYFE